MLAAPVILVFKLEVREVDLQFEARGKEQAMLIKVVRQHVGLVIAQIAEAVRTGQADVRIGRKAMSNDAAVEQCEDAKTTRTVVAMQRQDKRITRGIVGEQMHSGIMKRD